jgi:carbonic anhydrase/acetyltransferase-like protein (isoleucine patch superfamily)
MSKNLIVNLVLLISLLSFGATAFAQTTSFTYQGKLNDGALPANGTYQFQFKLFDQASGGNQVGQTIADLPATVTNGIFAVNLDFGASSFDGAARFIEISVKSGGQSYTTLSPRQPVTSTPYAIRALNANQANQSNTASTADNAANLGGIAANQYVLTTDPRLSQSPGGSSGSFIQNSTVQQPNSNFTISGEGKADKFTAATQFNIGVNRVLASSNANLFVGFGTGNGGAIGGLNTFVGNNAGMNTANATRNSFFGAGAGIQNTVGNDNSYFGAASGLSNQTGDNNSFFGSNAGNLNTADNNSFFGATAGKANTTGGNNSFFGFESGLSNKGGAENSFFGGGAGKANTNGIKNSFFGRNAGVANNGDFNSFFGTASGQANTEGIGNSFFGDSTGLLNKTGGNNSFFGKGAGLSNNSGSNNVFVGFTSGINNTTGSNNTLIGANTNVNHQNNSVLNYATAIGAGAVVHGSDLIVLGRNGGQDTLWVWGNTLNFGKIKLGPSASGGGSQHVCIGTDTEIGAGVLSLCSSSIRYKTNVENFTRGLDLINRLRPVSFDWKSNGQRDVGFIAEEVNQVEPLLNEYKPNGEIEGVKYAQITTALVNAVKEQQEQIRQMQAQMEALKALACAALLVQARWFASRFGNNQANNNVSNLHIFLKKSRINHPAFLLKKLIVFVAGKLQM